MPQELGSPKSNRSIAKALITLEKLNVTLCPTSEWVPSDLGPVLVVKIGEPMSDSAVTSPNTKVVSLAPATLNPSVSSKQGRSRLRQDR